MPLEEYVHRLLDLPLVGLVEHHGDYLLDPYCHLPSLALLLLGGPAPLGGRRVVAVPPRSVPEGVSHAVDTLLAQHLKQAGDASLLYLFKGL